MVSYMPASAIKESYGAFPYETSSVANSKKVVISVFDSSVATVLRKQLLWVCIMKEVHFLCILKLPAVYFVAIL